MAALPIAGTLSVSDGPIPIGEIAALALIGSALYEDITNPMPGPYYTDRPLKYIPDPPQGFDFKNPQNFPDKIARWFFAGFLGYQLYRNLDKTVPDLNPQPIPVPADNTRYFVPKPIYNP